MTHLINVLVIVWLAVSNILVIAYRNENENLRERLEEKDEWIDPVLLEKIDEE